MQLHVNRPTPIGIRPTRSGFVVILARATSAVPGRQAPVLSLGQEFNGRMAQDKARRAAGTDTVIPADETASETLGRLA